MIEVSFPLQRKKPSYIQQQKGKTNYPSMWDENAVRNKSRFALHVTLQCSQDMEMNSTFALSKFWRRNVFVLSFS